MMTVRARFRFWTAACGALAFTAWSGCEREGCLGGDDGVCVPAAACPALTPVGVFDANALRIGVAAPGTGFAVRSPGEKAQAAGGDFVLENDRVRAVIDAPDHAQGLAPSGGGILDLAPIDANRGDQGDQLAGVFQVAGVLPRDAVVYRRAQVIDQRPAFVALILRGELDGDRRVTVVTRYELRGGESGLRVRSELWNGSDAINTFYLTDAFFWGDRTLLPFVPLPGQGFRQPALDLLELGKAWRAWPFLAARAQTAPWVSYAAVPCGITAAEGFNESTLSAAGVGRVPTLPGDAIAFERFITVAAGPGLAPAVDQALRARTDFFSEPEPAIVLGRVVVAEPTAPHGEMWFDPRAGRAASVLIYEPAPGPDPDAENGRRPWSEAVPASNGYFAITVPPGRPYRLQPYAFGRPAGPVVKVAAPLPGQTLSAGTVLLERPARLRVTVHDGRDQPARFSELVLTPVTPRVPTVADPAPSLYGLWGDCDPMLGPPHGASPACNRALILDGASDLLVPAGHYYAYVTRGPFATLDRHEITLAPGDDVQLDFTVDLEPILPPGVLSGDFHVHGAGSFDSSLPDADRVATFLAAGVDVIAATDHDVVSDYATAVGALGVAAQLVIMPGVELTPNILYFRVPGETFPKTVGHFNFWPLRHDTFQPRNGAPWDELIEPGVMMDRVERLWATAVPGVRQLNHPWSDDKLGRDQGFLRMLGYDPRTPIVAGRSFAADVLLRRPGGGHRNLDWDTQEVMSGAPRRDWIRYRALWFSLLNQGLLKAGLANSDTHTFAIEKVGYPRTLVWGGHTLAAFDVDRFNADLKAGHAVGTNGPVLDVSLTAAATIERPGVVPVVHRPGDGAIIDVAITAMPFVPVAELRFVVNGTVVRTLPVPLADGASPTGPARRHTASIALDELLTGAVGDAWLVVEAGLPLPITADLDDDGLPDVADNNGDGRADAADLPSGEDRDDDDLRFPNPTRPANDDPRFSLETLAPGTWPYAFTNPFVIDRNGDGFVAPGLPGKGSR